MRQNMKMGLKSSNAQGPKLGQKRRVRLSPKTGLLDRFDIWDNNDIPVTKLQRLMLSRYERVPNSGLMVIGSFKVPASYIHRAKKSLDSLVKNHPIMRSVCKKVGDDYVLHINPPQLSRHALIVADSEEKNNVGLLQEILSKPIELETSAPFRVAALPIDGDQYLISVSCHYVLCDRASGSAIVKDFKNSIITGIPIIRKTWLNDFHDPVDSQTHENDVDHLTWQMRHIYNDYRFRKDYVSLVAPHHVIHLDHVFSARLTSLAVSLGVTKFSIVTCLFDLFIQNTLADKERFIIGSPILLREEDDDSVFPKMDYCLVRSTAEVSAPFKDNCLVMFKAIQASLVHHVPMAELVEHFQDKKAALFDYLIAYYPKGLVDEEIIMADESDASLTQLVPFEGAKGGLLVVEFFDNLCFRLSLDATHFGSTDVARLNIAFKKFAERAICPESTH